MEQQSLTNETQPVGILLPAVIESIEVETPVNRFISANTIEGNLYDINNVHIIPSYQRDYRPLIGHGEFVDAALVAVSRAFPGERISKPDIRLSHPVLGRIPEAKDKPAKDLLDHERTLMYDRLAFLISVPGIHTYVDGKRLNLTVGGVRAYSSENLMSRSYEQTFKVAVGMVCKVCTNLCISSDGLVKELTAKTLDELYHGIFNLIDRFDAVRFAQQLNELPNYELTEHQFATFVGRCRLYRCLPASKRLHIPQLLFGDSLINTVVNDYFSDNSFCSNPDGSINLWNFFNLLTGANRNSYIDSYLDRAANAFSITQHLKDALDGKAASWYLS
jgi:hypothetical protein